MKSTRLAWTAMGAGLVLAASAPVYAQAGQEDVDVEVEGKKYEPAEKGESGEKQHKEHGEKQKSDAQGMIEEGTARGTISSVDFQQGTVTIKGEEGATNTYRAKPNQIAALREGEEIEAPFATYGERSWLLSNLDQEATGRQFGRSGQVMGEVSELDANQGKLTISTEDEEVMNLRAHPSELEQLKAGQSVNVSFYRVGQNDWVQSIEMAEGGKQPSEPQQGGSE